MAKLQKQLSLKTMDTDWRKRSGKQAIKYRRIIKTKVKDTDSELDLKNENKKEHEDWHEREEKKLEGKICRNAQKELRCYLSL